MPTRTEFQGMSVYKPAEVEKLFPQPLTMENIQKGIAALQMLNVLEQWDLKSLGHNSADHIHLFVEAKKLAFADRAKFYADPAFGKLPVDELISKEYAKRQAARIDEHHARDA